MIKIIFIFIILIIILFIIVNSYCDNEKFNNNDGIYTAIIIEPRKHKAMEFVLTNFTNFLDKRWNFIIFHGNNNKEYITNIIDTKLVEQKNRIKLISLNVDNLESASKYNNILYDKLFYNNIPTEIFLVFQTDSMICSSYKDVIYKFIEEDHDYIGAPWALSGDVGNGGLSLRKKSKMIELIDKCGDKIPVDYNEDYFFSNLLCHDLVNVKKPDYNSAKEFAIETVYNDKSFGIHRAWKYIPDQVSKMNDFCPGLNELISLQ